MRIRKTAIFLISIVALLSFTAKATAVSNDQFTIGLGPITLGNVVMKSNCNVERCTYEARVKGSFMFIGAKINEKGTYNKVARQITPVLTEYAEKIGSKKKAFTYDFLNRKMTDKRKHKQHELPDDVYPFMPLINQVILDLELDGPRDYYDYLSKHKVKRAIISDYTQKPTKNGTLHHFVGTRKDDELEFFFLENARGIKLEKIAYGSFHMSKKHPKKSK